MSEQRSTPGRVVWRDLMTRDAAKARAFYGGLFGWRFEKFDPGTESGYEVIKLGEKPLGGLWQIAPGNPASSLWLSYMSVEDVDAVARIAQENGGKLVHGPGEIRSLGRFVVLADFDSALSIAFRAEAGDPSPEPPQVGEFCWETLGTTDEARAKAFYGKLYGWKTLKIAAGALSVFSTDGTPRGQVADLQNAQGFRPSWITYVLVEKLGPACDRASELGAEIPLPFASLPKVGRIALLVDPTGAPLGLYEPAGR